MAKGSYPSVIMGLLQTSSSIVTYVVLAVIRRKLSMALVGLLSPPIHYDKVHNVLE